MNSPPSPPLVVPGLSYPEAVRRFKREWLTLALQQHRGNRRRTARAIGLCRTYLLRLIVMYDIHVESDPLAWPSGAGSRRPPLCGICAALGHNARRHHR